MRLSRECEKCHFIDYLTVFDPNMHLARDELHLNRKGAYVLKTVMESFVVDLDVMQINSADKFVSSDMCHTVDTRMSYADVAKQFPPREKLQAMDNMQKKNHILMGKPFIPKFRWYKQYRVPVSRREKKIRAA
ncbi:hypothetical protein CHS0354_003973 [Potamilus streckersoni]|uniref:Uncharacterized protein n=1 Tax=Potamilus streckersoni TaxID=2493646 RepID=A0AAE0W8F2_9BIVA|nr:hypothetical protein CHS0354_003973 [Potamilus streckersoni]